MKWKNKGHQFDEIGTYLKDIRNLYIYGAGTLGASLLRWIKKFNPCDCEIIFIDADKQKQKEGYYGIEVLSPECFFQTSIEKSFVVIAVSQENSYIIEKDLKKRGYKENVNFLTIQQFWPIYSIYVKDMISFPSISFLPTTRCNLNCAACLNFNSYNENQGNRDLDSLKADIDIFFKCVDYIGLFHISGGDPLLYPQLDELVAYIDCNYRKHIDILSLTTNGTIAPDDALCKIFKKHNLYIILDDYRENVPSQLRRNFDIILEKMKNYGITYEINKVDRWIDLRPLTTNHFDWSEQRLIAHYENCRNPFQELRNKKIYSCNYASYAMKAGLNLDSFNDYYDLSVFSPEKKKELVEFRLRYTEKGYVDFCKRCSGLSTTINSNFVEVARQIPRK